MRPSGSHPCTDIFEPALMMILQMQGGAEMLAKADDQAWAQPLGAAILAIRHIGLGAGSRRSAWPWRTSWAAGRAWAGWQSPPTCSGAVCNGLWRVRERVGQE